jgi:hypothetical protein
MKKSVTFLTLLIWSNLNFALEVEFVGPCSSKPLAVHKIKIPKDKEVNIGQATVLILKKYKIEYQGSANGINSIFKSPTGLDAIEDISDTEMLAYGWCFSVNKIQPKVYPNKIRAKNSDKVRWWFGYAHYKEGKWLNMCVPAFKYKNNKFCRD